MPQKRYLHGECDSLVTSYSYTQNPLRGGGSKGSVRKQTEGCNVAEVVEQHHQKLAFI